MENLRLLSSHEFQVEVPCLLCEAVGFPWDQIGRHPICTDCQESLMSGMVPPWQLIAEPRSCVLCEQRPTLPWLTCPLSDPDPIEMDLCSPHLHALLSRRLSARAYRRLRRKLNRLGFAIEQFFLLHESFYDEEGIALQPLGEF